MAEIQRAKPKFNPHLTGAEYNALPPAAQRQWDLDLLDSWTEGSALRVEIDNQRDDIEYRQEQGLPAV